MTRYSGDDSVNVYLDVFLYKSSNGLLNAFDESDKKKTIEVWLGENKIDKFYIHDLEVDLADQTNEVLFNYLIDYYNKEEEKIIQEVELSIDYHVSGYYDPGNTYGPPENCYPPEGDEERNVEDANLIFIKDISLKIPKEHLVKIQDVFDKEINSGEFYPEEDYGPEPDEYYEGRYEY